MAASSLSSRSPSDAVAAELVQGALAAGQAEAEEALGGVVCRCTGYAKIIDDCQTLGPNSFGIYWATGAECRINANTQVGSPDAPVMLISATSNTQLNGGAKVYGTLFVTDVEDSAAELNANGTNTVYGSVIVDGNMGLYLGTFQVVWNDNTSRKAGSGGGLGAVVGGWSDFHRDWTFE